MIHYNLQGLDRLTLAITLNHIFRPMQYKDLADTHYLPDGTTKFITDKERLAYVKKDLASPIDFERMREVTYSRLGLYDKIPTFDTLGRQLRLTRERVRQLEVMGMKRVALSKVGKEIFKLHRAQRTVCLRCGGQVQVVKGHHKDFCTDNCRKRYAEERGREQVSMMFIPDKPAVWEDYNG